MNRLFKTLILVFLLLSSLLLSALLWRAGKNTVSVKGRVHFQNVGRNLVFYSEDESNEQLRLLRKNERLDEFVAGAADETEKAKRLMGWTAGMKWENNQSNPYPGWNALTILDWIRSGKTGGHCGQRGIIFGQACQSFGIPVRYVDLSSEKKRGGDILRRKSGRLPWASGS